MKKFPYPIFTVVLSFFFFSCEEDVKVEKSDSIDKIVLTAAQLDLRAKLKEATLAMMEVAKDKQALGELVNLIGHPDIDDDRISFKEAFYGSKTNQRTQALSTFRTSFRQTVARNRGDMKNARTTGVSDLDAFLAENDVDIYIPYPIEDYPEENRKIAFSYDPIDNEYENEGFMLDPSSSTGYKIVTVNEEFSETYPIAIIDIDDDNEKFKAQLAEKGIPFIEEGNARINVDENQTSRMQAEDYKNPNKIYMVTIGDIYLREHFDGAFNGDNEVYVLRGEPELANNTVISNFTTIGGITIKRKYTRYAKKGWAKGWRSMNVQWDSDWILARSQQVFASYEWDPKGEIEISGTAKYKIDENNEQTIVVKDKFSSESAVLGKDNWSRDAFFAFNKIGGTYNNNGTSGGLRNGWRVWNYGYVAITAPVQIANR